MSKLVNELYINFNGHLKRPTIPYRYFIMVMITMTTIVVIAVRSIINVAILAMIESAETSTGHVIGKNNFNWDQRDQGYILGAYYYTYTAIQIGAGSLTDKFNAVHVFAGAQVIATICTLITPIAAKMGMYYLIGVRMVLGLIHGTTFPTLYILIAKWFLPSEVGLAQGLMAAGSDAGSAIVLPLTAWISTQSLCGGWPAAFYLVGLINLIFVLTWVFTVTVDPQSNKFVSEYEKHQLIVIKVGKSTKKQKKSTPWIKFLTSLPLWSVIIARGLMGLAHSLIYAKVPVYLCSVLGYNIKDNGSINAIFYIAMGVSQFACAPLAKYIMHKGWLSPTATRKLFESVSICGVIINLVAVCYLRDHPRLIVFSFIGTTYGFANTLSCAAGFITPAFVGFILGNEAHSQHKWVILFQITIGLQVVALVLFNLFATAEPLAWR
uniref:Major facilitator superfamily (MFS) profile domain-containing protein n=1 Tax=Tetranychus urticae TaxID=32264 RepID=T1KRX7_TETUR